jgi:hypothetical protein
MEKTMGVSLARLCEVFSSFYAIGIQRWNKQWEMKRGPMRRCIKCASTGMRIPAMKAAACKMRSDAAHLLHSDGKFYCAAVRQNLIQLRAVCVVM